MGAVTAYTQMPFQILGPLGQGAMGQVFRAQPFAVGILIGFMADHALGIQAVEWFLHIDQAAFVQRPCIEPGV